MFPPSFRTVTLLAPRGAGGHWASLTAFPPRLGDPTAEGCPPEPVVDLAHRAKVVPGVPPALAQREDVIERRRGAGAAGDRARGLGGQDRGSQGPVSGVQVGGVAPWSLLVPVRPAVLRAPGGRLRTPRILEHPAADARPPGHRGSDPVEKSLRAAPGTIRQVPPGKIKRRTRPSRSGRPRRVQRSP